MHDRRKRIHRVAIEQDIHLDQVRLLLPRLLVVEGRIPLGAGLERIKEIENDFAQRHGVAQFDPILGKIVHAPHLAAFRLTQLHSATHELAWHNDRGLDDGLPYFSKLAPRPIGGVMDVRMGTVLGNHPVGHRRRGRNQVQTELSFESVAGDFHVE